MSPLKGEPLSLTCGEVELYGIGRAGLAALSGAIESPAASIQQPWRRLGLKWIELDAFTQDHGL